jgi:hypothetical protein
MNLLESLNDLQEVMRLVLEKREECRLESSRLDREMRLNREIGSFENDPISFENDPIRKEYQPKMDQLSQMMEQLAEQFVEEYDEEVVERVREDLRRWKF